jgi:hypothetical protein
VPLSENRVASQPIGRTARGVHRTTRNTTTSVNAAPSIWYA